VSTLGLMRSLAAGYFLLCGPLMAGALAQVKFDLRSVTCQHFLAMPPEHSLIVMGWLQGYYLEEDAEPVVDVDKVLADLQRLTEHCKLRLDQELMAASDQLFGKPPAPAAEPPPRQSNGSER